MPYRTRHGRRSHENPSCPAIAGRDAEPCGAGDLPPCSRCGRGAASDSDGTRRRRKRRRRRDAPVTQRGKHLSYVLRHDPGDAGVSLSTGGWADVGSLVAGLGWDRATFDEVIAADAAGRGRYEVSPDGRRVRAHHGHSVEVDLAYEAEEPPDVLYHGTAADSVPSIMGEGLLPQSRQFVHLSGSPEEAREVGARHGSPVILTVDAKGMRDAGIEFFPSGDGVWLVGSVPTEFLSETGGNR